ncbi:hypothetical protein Godav_011591, partial [Gossypium davidsonii]|nr:hypothetical protein [Gossypium davidsonii]
MEQNYFSKRILVIPQKLL